MTLPDARSITHIVSLGVDCQVAYNLRRHFDFGTAYPFDWWITPLAGAVSFLADPDVDRLYDPDLLVPIIRDGTVRSIRNTAYGIRLVHEFPRDAHGSIVDGAWLRPGPGRARTRKLVGRLLDLDRPGNAILFVRDFRGGEPQEDAEPLWRAVRDRCSRASGQLLLVDPPGVVPEGTLAIRSVDGPPTGPQPWMGSPEAWSTALASVPIRFTDVEERPYSWAAGALHTG